MHRIRSSLHFTACVFNNRCISSVLFQLFFFSHHSWSNPWLQYYINSARALFLAAEEVTRVFFFFHLISRSHFSHPNFTNCKLHTRMLTDTDLWRVRCSPIDSWNWPWGRRQQLNQLRKPCLCSPECGHKEEIAFSQGGDHILSPWLTW